MYCSKYKNNYSSLNSKSYLCLILLLLIIFNYSCSTTKRFEKSEFDTSIKSDKLIRVLISESKKFKILLESESEIVDKNGKRINVEKNSSVQFIFSNKGIKILVNEKEFRSQEFLIFPPINNYLQFNGKKYRGLFKLVSNSTSILLINYLDIEDYVKGVILMEMPLGKGNDNYEAIKAFSILARTFALKRKIHSKDSFDLYSDTRDQVYGGIDSENEISNSLVDFTKGQILSYENNIATVFYHSTCGGYTENVENVFNSNPFPYLVSLKDDNPPNCKISPRFDWEEKLSNQIIAKRLFESKLISDKNSIIKKIEIVSRFESGRVNKLKITVLEYKMEKEIELYSNNIRFVLKNSRGKILPSSNFQISTSGNNFVFKGIGFGHGVGMCQWGAINLSRNGKSYLEILNHYFPKTEIKKLYD